MISAAKTTEKHRGFSLLEIVMVLAIASIVIGGAVSLMVYSADERTLRDASGEIELLAKRARTISILEQTPYALEFKDGIVRLLPFAQAGMPTKKGLGSGKDASQPAEGSSTRELVLNAGLAIFIRRWNSEEWLSTTKNTIHVWRFDPDGLCEPVSVRLTLGKSWAEDTYHPLTASVSESLLETQ
jgi:prepilin-type N-terminal cleavage/methylation domain-containing protein